MPKPPLPEPLHEFLAQHDGRSRYGDRKHKRVSAWLDVENWHAWGLSAELRRR